MMIHPFPPQLRRHRGISLIEMLVGIAISLIVSLVMLNVLANNEAQRRAITGASDAQQNGVATFYKLDRIIRMAGAGLVYQPLKNYGSAVNIPDYPTAWGCQISMNNNGPVYPRAAAFPAPFAAVNQNNLRLLPILAYDGGGANNSNSDVVIAMSSQSSATGRMVMAAPGVDRAQNAGDMGLQAGEFRLRTSLSPNQPCWIDRLASNVGASLSGATSSSGAVAADPDFLPVPVAEAYIPLGTNPVLSMVGVNAAQQLIEYDFLGLTGGNNNMLVMAENVVNMQVLYGLYTGAGASTDYSVDTWVTPTGAFAAANLSNGLASPQIASIMAVRLAVVVRSTQPVNSALGAATLTLFADQPAASQTMLTFTTDQQRYRYQVYDMVIPLKSMQRFMQTHCPTVPPTIGCDPAP
jgi:type IV pilus assembly protein PilW